VLSKQGTTSKVENTANEGNVERLCFPPLLLSSLQMALKVILKIACKATKASKYLNNSTSQNASQKCQSKAKEDRKIHLKTKQKENND